MLTQSSIAGKDFLDTCTVGLTRLVAGGMREILGPSANETIFDRVTWADLATTICLVLLMLLVNALAVAFVRRKLRQTKPSVAAADVKAVQHHVFDVLGKPLYLLIWVFGVYLAVTPLLLKIPQFESLQIARAVIAQLFDLGVFAALFWLFFRLTRVLETRLDAWAASGARSQLDELLVQLLGRSLRIIVPVIGIILALPILNLSTEYAGVLAKASSILLIIAVAVILFQAVHLGEKAVLTRFDITAADNLRARTVYTQVQIIQKVLYTVIGLFTIASVLMLFTEVRQFGTSILASAGVVGVIVGFAAQKTIANLSAGFQLAMTQPIRLDDVVIVENEWGRVEEITLTYVVIHIWDDRRLIVPLSYFIEKPFQNWTRVSAQLLGSVFLWVDYSLPLDGFRRAVQEIIEPNPLWDKRYWNMQVTDASEKAMRVRVLATAADASKSWDLCCDIREKLIAHVQQHYPQSLPRFRAQFADGRLDTPIASNGRA